MNLLMFSINPIFPDKVLGGATKHLRNIAVHMGDRGHEVSVLCTRRDDSRTPFQWRPNVTVYPYLMFNQPFPEPYHAPAYDLANTFQEIAGHMQRADAFYIHDGTLLFPPLYQKTPTVTALRSDVAPETILGAFLFRGDELICLSESSRAYYLSTVGRFFPYLADRTQVIHNGIDFDMFKPTPPEGILSILDVDPQQDAIILHPYRPEPSKGMPQTIQVVEMLVKRYNIPDIKVLVPQWEDDPLPPEIAAYMEEVREEIAERGLTDHFIFHKWIPYALMPQYYSLGTVALVLGHFADAFGNTPYEAMACGTPAITARVGAHRELLPDELGHKVHFGDVNSAAQIAARIIAKNKQTPQETLDYLHEHYNIEQQLNAYAEVIENVTKRPDLIYSADPIDDLTPFTLAPWCYEWEGVFFHDFRATQMRLYSLSALLEEYPDGFSYIDAKRHNVMSDEVTFWYQMGYIVPTRVDGS